MNTVKQLELWDTIPQEFNDWWNEGYIEGEYKRNPYTQDSAAFWAWEGWKAAIESTKMGCDDPDCDSCL